MSEEEIQRLMKEREVLLGLLIEAEGGRNSTPHYGASEPDLTDASIEATRGKLARIEALLAGRDGQG